MGAKHNSKRLLVAAITIAGLTGGAMAAQAATLAQRVTAPAPQDLSVTSPPVWPAIAPTCLTDCTLWLTAGSSSVPVKDAVNGDVNVPILGFGVTMNALDTPVFALAGAPTSTIKVPVGTTLTINFDQTTIGGGPVELSFPSLGANKVSHSGNVYTVHADTIGTSVFQPGANNAPGANKQAPVLSAMGLVGVLIVTPKDGGGVDCASCAYDTATSYADEALVATTDLDYEFATAYPADFDISYFGQPKHADDTPRRVYHVINGKSFPDTDVIDARTNDKVLLRYVNAGVSDKTMGLLGLRQTLLARNASAYQEKQSLIAPLIGPGETADVEVVIPGDAIAGQKYSLMDQGRQMNHGTASGYGGALTFLNVWAGNVPTVSAVAYNPSTHTVTATGTPSSALNTLTGYQTAVTPTATPPLETDWTTPVDTFVSAPGAGATAPIIKILSPAPPIGSYVWVRVTQSAAVSAPGSALVTAIDPTVSNVALNAGIVTADALSDPTLTITGFQILVNAGGLPDWSIPPVEPVAIPAPSVSVGRAVSGNGGDTIWVRVQDTNGTWSAPGSVVIPTPVVNPTFVTPDLTIVAMSGSSTAYVQAAEWSVGPAPAAAGSGTPVGTASLFGTPGYIETITLSPAPIGPDTIWVRVQNTNGTWSDAVGIPFT